MLRYGWQLDKTLWDQIPADLRESCSWRFVDVASVSADMIPSAPGIYLFCTYPVGCRRLPSESNSLFGNLLAPIYIGQSTNLRRRFLQHCRRPPNMIQAAQACFGADMTFWFHRRRRGQIKADEAALIHCFGPTANLQSPPSITARLRKPVRVGI